MSAGLPRIDLNSDVLVGERDSEAHGVSVAEAAAEPVSEPEQVQNPLTELVEDKIDDSREANGSTEGMCEVSNVDDVKAGDDLSASLSHAGREDAVENINSLEKALVDGEVKSKLDEEGSVLESEDVNVKTGVVGLLKGCTEEKVVSGGDDSMQNGKVAESQRASERHNGFENQIMVENNDPLQEEENISIGSASKNQTNEADEEQTEGGRGSNVVDVKASSLESKFQAPDLVWGKVRSHPWWPGQIFDTSASTKKAKKYFKKDTYLIAYFGDQTFAWNEASKIKPFQEHFFQLEKQSNLQDFRDALDCALDEFSRRVEVGLACSCLPEEIYSELKTQVVVNAGIREECKKRIDGGGDRFLNAKASFDPKKLVKCIKALAEFPLGKPNRLELVISRAQISAFYRSKGYYELPGFTVPGGLMENDTDSLEMEETKEHDSELIKDEAMEIKGDKGAPIQEGNSKSQDSSSLKRKNDLGVSGMPSKKEKTLADVMAEKTFHSPKNENGYDGRKSISSISGKKRKPVDAISVDSAVKSGISLPSTQSSIKSVQRKPGFGVGDSIKRVASKLNGLNPILKPRDNTSLEPSGKNTTGEKNAAEKQECRKIAGSVESSSLGDLQSQLFSVASDPKKNGYSFLVSMVDFFSEFRDSVSLSNGNSEELEWYRKQVANCKTWKKSTKTEKTKTSKGKSETSELDSTNDSYWTDRVIQKDTKPKPNSDPESNIHSNDASMEEDIPPTALILNFSDSDSIPSETQLNKIFSRHGELIESETQLLKKSTRAKVVFKRSRDAEAAFSSAGKYSTFGPSLVSYKLKYQNSKGSPSSVAKRSGKEIS